MKKLWLMLILALVSVSALAEAAAPAAKEVNFDNVRRWKRNTCAKSFSVKKSEQDNAIVFRADFKDRVDNCWCYPTFTFRPNEDVSNATGLTYEIKLSEDSYALTGSHLTMLGIRGQKTKYLKAPNATNEWQTVTVDFGATPEEMKKVSHIAIGMHSEDQVLVYMIRNVKLITK